MQLYFFSKFQIISNPPYDAILDDGLYYVLDFNLSPMIHDDAKAYCEHTGGALARPRKRNVFDFLRSALDNHSKNETMEEAVLNPAFMAIIL